MGCLFSRKYAIFTRSWTGSCIFELPILEGNNNTYVTDHFLVETNTEIYRRINDNQDSVLIRSLLEWFIDADKEND